MTEDQSKNRSNNEVGVVRVAVKTARILSLNRLLRIREAGVVLAVVVIISFFSFANPRFLAVSNLLNIMRQISQLGVVAVAVTILMISQEFDLSVGSTFALSAVVVALLVKNGGFNIWIAAPMGLGVGAFLGLINGIITTKLRVPSFITTLGTMMLYRGVTLILCHGWPIAGVPPSIFYFILGGKIFGVIPFPAIWMTVLCIGFWILLDHTRYGNRVFATGSNKEAAGLSGIDTDKVKIINFVLVGVFTSFAALLQFSFLGSVTPTQGAMLELEAIAATVIGGTALFGGSGTVIGTLLGAIIMGSIRNGLVLLGLTAYWQNASLGLVIIISVIINILIERGR